ncbi:oxidative damage protection protein [Longimicrobium sp.]|uniref:oxidative damage protection protein n=1 Tax=Longimicrobium sp. TaxID=2029185 RepID=UPI002B5EAF82|nr:oxidative damage protection protein [Longimicrobium sp.]HSU17452.1 oxidative damage protection protein [Longimicrobium sp.]
MADVTCVRCGQTRPGLAWPPFNNDLGKKLQAEVCQDCWAQWLQRQTALINHYGLNLRDPESRKFLTDQTTEFFFGTGETEKVDTSKQGTVQW